MDCLESTVFPVYFTRHLARTPARGGYATVPGTRAVVAGGVERMRRPTYQRCRRIERRVEFYGTEFKSITQVSQL